MIQTAIVTRDEDNPLAIAGRAANEYAARSVFAEFRGRKADNTLYRQDHDLRLFTDFLAEAGLPVVIPSDPKDPPELAINPEAWRGMTWGLVEGFCRWQLKQGYAVSSVNVRLGTVKAYVKLALKAGAIAPADYAMIATVKGYSDKEGKNVDDKRSAAGMPTRIGIKKAEAVSIDPEQAAALIDRPHTPQGRRDALLMCLLLEHGLRVGEVAGLQVADFNLKAGTLTFYRPKVDMTQTHALTSRTLQAAKAYFRFDAPETGELWRKSASKQDGKTKAHKLTGQGMKVRALTKRVNVLGEAVGLKGLSAHDCRHYWATQAARNGTPIDRLKEAGGWKSAEMPLHYIEAAKIANEGVKLSK